MFKNNLTKLVLVAIPFSLSCYKKTWLDPNKQYLLTHVTENGRQVVDYTYDDQYRVAQVTYTNWAGRHDASQEIITYTYGADNRVQYSITKYLGYNPGPDSTVYQYDNEGRIAAQLIYDRPTKAFEKAIEYSYNSNSIVQTVTSSGIISSVTTFDIDANGNITKISTDDRTASNSDRVQTFSDYDNRPNVTGLSAGSVRSKNNPRRQVMTWSSGQTGQVGYTDTRYTYIINELGMLIASRADNKGDASYYTVKEYIYTPVD